MKVIHQKNVEKKLEELYYLAEFKMKLIQKWISGEFYEAAKEFEKQKAANNLEKVNKEANENLIADKISGGILKC